MRTVFVLCFLLLAALAGWAAAPSRLSTGVGIGTLYAGIGVNLEYRLSGVQSVSAGLNPFSESLRYAGTAHFYLTPPERPRARVRLDLGISNSIGEDGFDDTDSGNSKIFFGLGWTPNQTSDYRGWNLDIILADEHRGISFGYNF